MRNASLSIALLVVAALPAARAAQHPNLERGLSPAKAYQSGDVDTVNLFNGTINIRLPLGLPYRVGGDMSYAFSVSYATNTWDANSEEKLTCDPGGTCRERTYVYTTPDTHANAGHGWRLSFGELDGDAYVAADGSERDFRFNKLHMNDPNETSDSTVSYTLDSTYIRRKQKSGGWRTVEFRNGATHEFDDQGRLRTMSDQFGNAVNIRYTTRATGDFAGSSDWEITDTAGRTHHVYFRPAFSYADGPAREMVDYVKLAASNGRTAEYHFDYNAAPPGPVPFEQRLSRRCAAPSDSEAAKYLDASMLTAIRMPEGITYGFAYDLGDHVTCSESSGNISSLTLPTGGRVEWTYQRYTYPTQEGDTVGTFLARSSGIHSRKVFDGPRLLRETEHEVIRPGGFPEKYQARRVLNRDAGSVVNATIHYFTVCGHFCAPDERKDYGLPFARLGGSPPYLSTEFLTPDASGNLVVRRRTYATYEADYVLASFENVNPRVKATSTTFEDGATTTSTWSDFDGLGHYRTVTIGGTFGRGDSRTTTTNYNAAVGTYEVDANGNLTSTNYQAPATAAKWLLTTFTTQTSSEPGAVGGGSAAATDMKTSVCFDSSGFLTSRRVYRSFGASPTAQTSDLLSLFTRDAGGNLIKEQYFGGDDAAHPAPTDFNCGQSRTGETYRIDHAVSDGVIERSWYTDGSGKAMSFLLADREIDANTGLTLSSWEASTTSVSGVSAHDGLKTTFDYDLVGRPVKTLRDGNSRDASVKIVYANNPPKVEVRELEGTSDTSTVLRRAVTEFDALGRPMRETRTMPNGATSIRETVYNDLGWKTSWSDWGQAGALPFVRNTFDGFGRVVATTGPDGQQTTIEYSGVQSVSRKANVVTGRDAENKPILTLATVKEEYDRQGRLWRVTEPNGVVTEYKHDVGGRLTRVCAAKTTDGSCGQQRLFEYDAAGLLGKETHPEKGVSGNGSTEYRYDARGQVLRRIDGAANGDLDLSYGFDRAGRLTAVTRTNDGRLYKEFVYAGTNGSGSWDNGKVQTLIQHNWLDSVSLKVAIFEDYSYGAREGRASKRVTSERECAVSSTETCNTRDAGTLVRSFDQTFTFDQLGGTTSMQYPDCMHEACVSATDNRISLQTFDQGWLTGVTWTGASGGNAITYQPGGMIDRVTHANGVIDLHVPQVHQGATLSRLKELTTSGFTDPTNGVKPAFNEQPKSQTVTSGSSVTLRASATGETGQTISYQWYLGTPPNEQSPLTTGNELPLTAIETKTYWVKATNASGSTASVAATITVCTEPSFTSSPQSTSITRGQTVPLGSAATGTSPLSFQWYQLINGSPVIVVGATEAGLTVTPSATTTYRLVVSNGCGSQSRDAMVTVFDPPTTPQLTASLVSGAPELTWTASVSAAGISHYEIHRISDSLLFGTQSLGWRDMYSTAGSSYVYQVRAVDVHGAPSGFSNADLTTVIAFTDPVPQGQAIRGVHVSELRQAVDAVRSASGLARAWASYPPAAGLIYASTFIEIRDRLNEARQVWGMPDVVFPDVVAPGAEIRATVLSSLRGGTL